MKTKLIVSALGLIFVGTVTAQVTSFPDVKPGQWFYEYIMEIKNWGVVDGNDDGTFAPERNINRAEFSKMLVRYDERVDQKIDAAVGGISVPEVEVPEVKYLPSVMHLDRDNGVPNDCPTDWEEVQYGRIYENDNSLNRRTCTTESACRVMNLRNRDVEPASCPEGWSEADFGQTDNREKQRVCFVCVN